jgi:hypothetical protein
MAHEELQKIYELDALESDTPYDMWEFMNYMGEWEQHTHEPSWLPDYQYRRKQPRQTMKQINNQREFLQALLDGETVLATALGDSAIEWRMDGGTLRGGSFLPSIYPLYTKPKTININGFEVPEPLRAIPVNTENFWMVKLDGCLWLNSSSDYIKHALLHGTLHLLRENAEIHRNALLSFTRQDTK